MWWEVVVCVVAVFVNDIDIILTCSLGIQVFLRSREMGRESGGGGGCFCALSLTLGRLSTFHSIGLSSLQSNPQSPRLVNLAVTGSLRKFIPKPQIPQVSQISILVPLPATLAGGLSKQV